ncbi:reverse transcriptase domain-containing protein [Tanacetum coccineum]
MSTQFYSNQIKLHFPNPEKSLQFRRVEESESDNLFLDHIHGEDKKVEDVQMANHLRPIEELLQIPIVGIEDAIVIPAVLANEFELKIELLDFIRAAETWLENEPPCSITTWDDLVSKFLNRFYPHSKTREFRKEIKNFQQVFAGGNLMTRNTQEALTIIENKAKVRTCRNKPQVSRNIGTLTQIDAIAALTKQVEALRPSCVPPSNIVIKPRTKLKAITTMDGLTLDGSLFPHSNLLVYQEEEQEPETIKEVVEISSS